MAAAVPVLGLAGQATATSPSTIVYACGTASQICAIDPSTGAKTTLAQSGHLAGITSDGETYGYIGTDGPIHEAPVAGGTPTTGPTTGPTKAPSVTLSVPKQKLAAAGRHRRLAATCKMAGAATCTVRAKITAKAAKRLHLHVGKHAKTYLLARAAKRFPARGSTSLRLRLSAKEATALPRVHPLKITFTATSTAPGLESRRVHKTVTLR